MKTPKDVRGARTARSQSLLRDVNDRGREAAGVERVAEIHEREIVVWKTGAGRDVATRPDRRRLRFTGVVATGRAGRGRQQPRPVG